MCLTPKIIISREFIRNSSKFSLLYMNGKVIPYHVNPVYNPNLEFLSFRCYGVTPDNINNYYAFDYITGETLPVYMTVPCRKCIECRKQHLIDIKNRMLLEESTSKYPALFFTLTYNDSNLPKDGVSVLDTRLFFNRFYTYLRRAGYTGVTPRHIVFSEYCPSTGRPHYHGIIFNLDVFSLWPKFLDFCSWFESVWNKGFIKIKHFEPAGFEYVAKYLLKASCEPSGKNPIFWFGSRRNGGIGSSVLKDHNFIDSCHRNMATFRFPIRIFGKTYTITVPKYLRDKILPPLSKVLPLEVKFAISELIFTLDEIHTSSVLYPEFYSQASKYDFIFPPELVDKFPSHQNIFRYGSFDRDSFDPLLLKDVKSLINRYNECYNILVSFVKSDKYSLYLDCCYNRDLYLSSFRNRVQKYIEGLPPVVDRSVNLEFELNDVKSRIHPLK